MRTTMAARAWRMAVLAAGLTVLAGCGPRAAPRDPSTGEKSIMKLGQAYMAFAGTAKDGLGPANADELKKWLLDNDKRLTDLGLTRGEVDGIFVSPRDSQPYEIQPKRHPNPFVGGGGPPPKGVAGKNPGYGLPGILVNEKSGVDGKRMIFMSGSRMQEADQAEFQRLLGGS